jgi:hypothetical protein
MLAWDKLIPFSACRINIPKFLLVWVNEPEISIEPYVDSIWMTYVAKKLKFVVLGTYTVLVSEIETVDTELISRVSQTILTFERDSEVTNNVGI